MDKADAPEQRATKEGKETGKVTSEVYQKYLKAVNSALMVVLVAFFFLAAQALQSGVDFFVSIW